MANCHHESSTMVPSSMSESPEIQHWMSRKVGYIDATPTEPRHDGRLYRIGLLGNNLIQLSFMF
jgi:hypothetical protein